MLLLSLLPVLLCVMQATSSQAEECFCHERPYDRSQEPFRYDDCTTCSNCGEILAVDCIVKCMDPLPDVDGDGVCCPICPYGDNCEAEGEIIPAGESVRVGDFMCECYPVTLGYDPTQANCIPAPPFQ